MTHVDILGSNVWGLLSPFVASIASSIASFPLNREGVIQFLQLIHFISIGSMAVPLPTPMITLPIKQDYAFQILNGSKQIEIRRQKTCMNVRPGMLLSLHWYSMQRVEVPIADVSKWANVKEFLQYHDFKRVMPLAEEADEVLDPFANSDRFCFQGGNN